MVVRKAVHRPLASGDLPDFTPVPRRIPRHDGWTVERQRAFIEALADTGCVAIAARMVNMSKDGAYQLRRQPGATSFRRAWDAAQTLGLQPVKDEAFHRAMHGQLVPVFVAGKLMGFRRKKNDRLLMFILRHYGQDEGGRKTTINYFSTRASAGAQSSSPRFRGEGDHAQHGGGVAASEASTTTVKTVISGPAAAPTQLAADESATNVLNAFEGVALDETAQAEIYRALESCAERRRALEHDPENDPERIFVGAKEAGAYLGELEGGTEDDWIEYRPEGEHRWENLGEGGQAAEIDEVLRGMKERKALPAPEPEISSPQFAGEGDHGEHGGGAIPSTADPEPMPVPAKAGKGPEPPVPIPRTPKRAYKKRHPKPAFTPPDDARKTDAVAEVEAERQRLAAEEAERRKRKKRAAAGDNSS